MLLMYDLFTKLIIVMCCSTMLYFSGSVMNYISNKHKDIEWINKIIAFIDIILMAILIILLIRIMFIVIPYALGLITIIVVIDILIFGLMFIVEKIKHLIKK